MLPEPFGTMLSRLWTDDVPAPVRSSANQSLAITPSQQIAFPLAAPLSLTFFSSTQTLEGSETAPRKSQH